MHATSESDMTSVRPSSASPRGYYVQSPSRDSHDDIDKCSSSNDRSTLDSPTAPRHSLTSSSSTTAASRRRWNKHYCNVVSEEGAFHDDYYGEKAYARQCNCLILGFSSLLFFSLIWLSFFGVTRNYKSQVTIKVTFFSPSVHTIMSQFAILVRSQFKVSLTIFSILDSRLDFTLH